MEADDLQAILLVPFVFDFYIIVSLFLRVPFVVGFLILVEVLVFG